MGLGYAAGTLAFEVSPIILTGGIASAVGAIPIVAITQAADLVDQLLSGDGASAITDLSQYFAHFYPLAGASLIAEQVATYPFANQQVAANAMIRDPLNISMVMVAPARDNFGFAVKLATMTALQMALSLHNALGGMYSICTPSYIYTNCLLARMTDVSAGEERQPQTRWQLDFTAPLVTMAQASSAYNSLMSSLTSGAAPSVGTALSATSGLLTTSLSSFLGAL